MIKTLPLHLLLGAALLPLSALAHDAWIEPEGAGWLARFGHVDEQRPLERSRVRGLDALDTQGRPLALKTEDAPNGLRLQAGPAPALLLLHFDNGYWSRAPGAERSVNLPRHEVPGATAGTHSVKFGKAVAAWSPAVTQPRGHRLEIVPLAAQAPAVGGTLAVQVLWDGQPLPEARLLRARPEQKEPVVADAQGRAQVPVAAGWQWWLVSRRVPLEGDRSADTYAASASLGFHGGR